MVFNWFRRQFSEKEESSQETETTLPEVESPPEVIESPAEPSDSSQADTAAEYLQWAKAAYQNIQQQATTAPPEVAATSEEPADEPDAETPPNPATEVEPVADEPDAEVHSTEVESAEIDSETSSTELESAEIDTSEAEPEGEIEASTPSEVEPATPVPFWAQAEADRQARLERLKASAIAEPEVEQPQVAAPALPELAFDEGFLWSAEILAAQGRRPEDVSVEEITWLKKLRQGLDKTRRNLVNQLKAIVGQGPLNQAAVIEIESLLLQADVGVEATDFIINSLQNKLKQEALPADAAIAYLKQILRDMLDRPLESYSRTFVPEKDSLNIWLMTGVNGAGKTTTIGKLAHIAQKSGYKCLIGAADTFRAAAVEQVKIWGARSGIEVVANPGKNTDPAAVVFDAIAAAQSRSVELLLVDTAGRLQNKKNLMDELSKIRRIVDKKAPEAKVESLLVLDATLGQNGLRQAEVFAEAAQLSGVVLTKLDGTAKGGVALAVVQQLGLPIRFIGAGEGIEDLRPFSSYEFVEALLSS
ncbi:signal recognition particle-docking protein FtsY [Aliterella atlantica]|uniref:Signal recognition particle receptor FtsY n=1 Tax=Aliterella atlantica CENA595 TaxID=1618023 RepID=A0A0D8ZQW2_9CYAN|nr:signal recognition particle-docking protein FtsY [Aliterella atlantica]KJH70722.1 cell division protein [Aliterella atlantica CENA595]